MSDPSNNRTPSESPRGKRLAADTEKLPKGARIGDYVVEDAIAVGGFGTVYRVRHLMLGRPAALKVLHRELLGSADAILRFEREARAVNLIRHPNVVDIYHFGEVDSGQPYFVMELLAGHDLDDYVATRGALSSEETLQILEPLCDALAVAHAKGIIHRDIKATNVFLHEEDGRRRVVLLDFGVAKIVEAVAGGLGLTTSQHRIGTPGFMAPEQITGGAIDARTDIYGLGALAFQMLTGELPFSSESISMLQYMHLNATRPRPSTRTNVSPALDDVIVRAMSIQADHRYASAEELIAAFRDAVRRERGASVSRTEQPQKRRAVALHIDVRVDPTAAEEPDGLAVADMGAVIPLAVERMARAGFAVNLQTFSSALFARVLPGDPNEDRAAREQSVLLAQELIEEIGKRPTRDPRVHVNACMHAAPILTVGQQIVGGELLRLATWVPRGDVEGVVATTAVFDELTITTEPVPGSSELLRASNPGRQ